VSILKSPFHHGLLAREGTRGRRSPIISGPKKPGRSASIVRNLAMLLRSDATSTGRASRHTGEPPASLVERLSSSLDQLSTPGRAGNIANNWRPLRARRRPAKAPAINRSLEAESYLPVNAWTGDRGVSTLRSVRAVATEPSGRFLPPDGPGSSTLGRQPRERRQQHH
jgi:hypothetical protein